jgi:outer membrane protein assembly factor BamB
MRWRQFQKSVLVGGLVCGMLVAAIRANAAEPPQDAAQDRFPGGAALRTDADQQRLLKQAEQCVADGRLDLAAVLWQKVLDGAGDALFTRDGRFYTPLANEVERTLARLSPAALETYRTSADGEARALLAAADSNGEEQALGQVVRCYFFSSIGDDSAFKLACLALDRHDFVTASRLLDKILTSYPDSSIPKADLLLRQAVASAHLGDRQAAEQALAQIAASSGPRPPAQILDAVAADAKKAAAASATSSGSIAALPHAAFDGPLSELWTNPFPLDGNPAPLSREELIAAWKIGGWRPTGRLLFDGGRVYFKSLNRLLCFDSDAPSDQPLWQSAWENRYEPDSLSAQMAGLTASMGWNLQPQTTAKPKMPVEMQLFGDRVHASLNIAGGSIYSLEGRRHGAGEAAKPPARGRGVQWGAMPRRSRTNLLSAYQTSGGRALWTRPAGEEDQEGVTNVGFLAAPVSVGSVLLTPVTDGGTLWLFGLDQTSGKTLWKTYLCDEPPGGAAPWAEIVIAVDGREAYLTCGCGVIFAVDAVSASLRWAVRYPRDGKPNATLRQMFGNVNSALLDPDGWDDDVVIPAGRVLVVLSSDCDKLLAIDRRTGDLLWESPRSPQSGSQASYCLGVHDGGLFVAGKNVVRRYDLASGRLLWEWEIDDSFGRGCLTTDAIYLPVRNSILKLDLQQGRELARADVVFTSDEPLGNLFSDGEKLWAVGPARVYALTSLERRLALLGEKIAAGDAAAQLDRMRLQLKLNHRELAVADLRGADRLFRAQLTADEATLRVLAAMTELKLPQQQPLLALQLLTEFFVATPAPARLGQEAQARRGDAIAAVISGLKEQKTPGAVAALISAAPLLTEEYLLTAGTFAVDALATQDDLAALQDSLQTGSANARLLAIRAAARLAPDEKTRDLLGRLLPSSDDRVRLAAARALLNLGERAAPLETLVALAGSEDARVRSRAIQTLQALSGQQIAPPSGDDAAQRAAAVAAWRKWLQSSGTSASLHLPLTEQLLPLGRMVIVSLLPQGESQLVEFDADHKQRWQIKLPGPAWGCQGLPGGHRLVAIYSHSTIVEYDDAGREVWRKDRLPGQVYSVQRLETGSTLGACADIDQVVEIAPDGVTTSIIVPGRPISAQRLENGNTLVALQQANRVVEVDRSGQVVWTARTSAPPGHAQRLENGNTLVTLTYGRQVVELDASGQNIVWRTQVALTSPYAAQRLADGTTLVADHMGIHQIDASGQNVIWRQRQSQVTGVSGF